MKYKKDSEVSYTFGAFPTYELLLHKPASITRILLSDKLIRSDEVIKIENLAREHNVRLELAPKKISELSNKDNIFIMGEFTKYENVLTDDNTIVLVNPSDMGNLGTIIRTTVGFGIKNLVLIEPHADIFNPKTIRASMGAIFNINYSSFKSFEEFNKIYNHVNYMFALGNNTTLQNLKIDKTKKFNLVFGNEATGLPEDIKNLGETVFIQHTNNIDSLNLSISVGIAEYEFIKQIS